MTAGIPRPFDVALFLVMSLVWGSTWVATKIGLSAMPPIFFAALRFALVAAIVLIATRGTPGLLAGPAGPRLWASGVLVNTATYAPILWGMQYVASGVAGLVNLTVVVLGLYGLAVLQGQERASWRHALALAAGLLGLVALFHDKLNLEGGGRELLGIGAIVAGSLSYCLGSVLSRPLLATASPLQVTGAQALTGGLGLAALSLLLEPVRPATFAALARPEAAASLAFMVLFGTFVAYTIYLRLMRNWGSARAGLYAFVSPVVALVLGHLVFGEKLGLPEALGALLLLAAAAVAARPLQAAGDQG